MYGGVGRKSSCQLAGGNDKGRFMRLIENKYRVFLKKVLHKREEKMKMTLQKDENLAQVQSQCTQR